MNGIVESLIGKTIIDSNTAEQEDIHNVSTTPDEYQLRRSACDSCENLIPDEQAIGKCIQCDCPVNYLATFKFKTCPMIS